jgi:hypothetical protein
MSTGLAHLGFRSVPAKEALPKMNQATMVIVQLESAAALAGSRTSSRWKASTWC